MPRAEDHRVVIDEHPAGGLHVLQEEQRPFVVRFAVHDLLEQVLGLGVVTAILVEDTEVDERLQSRRAVLASLLVDLDRLVLLADEVEQIRKPVEMLGLVAVHDRLAIRLDRAEAVAGGLLIAALLEAGVGATFVDGAASDDGVETLGHAS